MFTKTYIDPDISSIPALYQSFIGMGITDIQIQYETDLTVSTNIGNEAQCDAAVASAATGSLPSNKTLRILEIQAHTQVLMLKGVETWQAGVMAAFSKIEADGWYTDYEYFLAHAAEISATLPYPVLTLDGRAILTSDVADIKTLVDNAVARLTYIYRAVSNADGSQGEMHYIQDIVACQTQAELDAIVDTRV